LFGTFQQGRRFSIRSVYGKWNHCPNVFRDETPMDWIWTEWRLCEKRIHV